MDNWENRSAKMICHTCMYFVVKRVRADRPDADIPERVKVIGRCRRHAPIMKGWPVIFSNDWCGDHKLDENKF